MDLPAEILHMIFTFCSVKDLLESVQFVCKKWHEAVLSPWLWREKILHIQDQNFEELKSQLIKLPFLKNAWVQQGRRQYSTHNALILLRENCHSLEYLRADCLNVRLFRDQISQFTCLTYIDLSFKKVTLLRTFESSHYRFAPLLRTVIFRNSLAAVEFLSPMLQCCKFLQHLVITHLNDLESFFVSSLRKTGSKDKTCQNDGLYTFYRSTVFKDVFIKSVLCHKLMKFHNMKHLAIKNNFFSDEEILQTVFKEPRPELVFLDLSNSCTLTADALDSVIKACPNLVHLSLRRCSVTDNTLLTILSFLPKLQYLNLHGTQISTQHFPSIPHQLPNLLDLNICMTRNIDQHTLNVLINQMPNLIIVHPKKGLLKGVCATERHHSFLEDRNALDA